MFSCEFFEIINENFFIKHLRATACDNWKNVNNWKNPHDCWLKIAFSSPLRFMILNDSILMDLLMGCRNSSEFSESFALLSMIYFSCLIIVGKVAGPGSLV